MVNGFGNSLSKISVTIILGLITNIFDIIYAFKIGMRLKFKILILKF